MCALAVITPNGKSPKTIRADYAELARIESLFAQEAATVRQIRSTLRGSMEVLQGGGWVGEGANAFYAEMNSDVLPALQRMEQAFEQAQQITRQIRGVMQQAEQDAARVFRADASRNATPGPSLPPGSLPPQNLDAIPAAPFEYIREMKGQQEWDKALQAEIEYQDFFRHHPDYKMTYFAIQSMLENMSLVADEHDHLAIEVTDPKHLSEALAKLAINAAQVSITRKGTAALLGHFLGDEELGLAVAANLIMGFQVLNMLQTESELKTYGLMNGRKDPEAQKWIFDKKLSLLTRRIAQDTGQDQSEILSEYHQFDKVFHNYLTYQIENDQMKQLKQTGHIDQNEHMSATPP